MNTALNKVMLVLCCVLALVFTSSVLAAMTREPAATTITVDTTEDAIAGDGFCSLREAIIAANSDAAFQECPAGSGADTIVFDPDLPQPSTLVLAIAGTGEDGALSGDLDITGRLDISATHPIVLDGNGLDRVLEIHPGARVALAGLTIRNGNPGPGADGGGIAVGLTGVLTLTNSTVISNTAVSGGGIQVLGRLTLSDSEVAANHGGGISGDGGLMDLSDVQIRNNGGYGIRNENSGWLSFSGGLVHGNQGGIRNYSAVATLTSVDIIGNTGSGGVSNRGTVMARLTMSACTVMSNTASNGAGIVSEGIGAQADIYNTDISYNTTTGAGGGVLNSGLLTLNGSTIRNNQARSGGGINHSGVSLAMTNDTVSGNTANDNGGGLYNRGDALLTNVTFSGNASGDPDTGGNIFNDTAELSLVNTIVAAAESGGNCFNSEGFLTSLGHNLDSGNSCGFAATGDLANTNPLLGSLQDNGGRTLTHALNPGSPAIDAGDDIECPATDQRGVDRPQGAACDMGAYESISGPQADLSIAKLDDPDPVEPGSLLTYTLEVSNSGPDPATLVTVSDTLPAGIVFQTAAGSGWSCDHGAGVVTCTRAELAASGSSAILIQVTAPLTEGIVSNQAFVDAAEPDPRGSDNQAGVETTVGALPPTLDHKAFLPILLR